MNKLLLLLFLVFCSACKKDTVPQPGSFVQVKFIEEEYYVPMEIVEGSWTNGQQLARLQATGYKFEQFVLYLDKLADTGYYPNPSIKNISWSVNPGFVPVALSAGYIHISDLNPAMVSGDFRVGLKDSLSSTPIRWVEGKFSVSSH
jgi:hypothetical protein